MPNGYAREQPIRLEARTNNLDFVGQQQVLTRISLRALSRDESTSPARLHRSKNGTECQYSDKEMTRILRNS